MSLVFVWFESLIYKIIVEKKYILQYTCLLITTFTTYCELSLCVFDYIPPV